MRRYFWKVAMCALALAGGSANAMPLGVRTMMHARVAVRQAEEEAERQAWTSNDGWTRQSDGSWKSGATADGATNSLTKMVNGAGTVTFRWKTSCEDYFYFKGMAIRQDALVFLVDGTEMGVANGIMSDWVECTFFVEGAGRHTLAWSYIKDVSGAEGEDCAWLDSIVWTPSATADTIPEIAPDAAPETVANAIDSAGFADADVKDVIGGSAAEYNAFKTWAGSVKHPGGSPSSATAAGEAAVVANTNAAAAFLLGAERLFENAPKVEIGEVVVGNGEEAGGGQGASRPTEVTVSVTVRDGEEAVRCAAEKVKEMFEATGDLGDWTGAAKLTPTVSVEAGEGATMRFKVTPGDGTVPRAFLRIHK